VRTNSPHVALSAADGRYKIQAVDVDLRQSMLQYYDERAPEYDDAYLRGTGTASIRDPSVFQLEAKLLGDVVERMARGRVIDLACGTGYWLQYYAQRCSRVTLVDQSVGMLNECARRITALGVEGRCAVVHSDVFDYDISVHDFALVGFLLSHLDDTQEALLFGALRRILGESGRFLILDSAWSPTRARFNAKNERQRRRLNNGTEFDIYKRYFDEQDVSVWTDKYSVTTSIEHVGAAFLAVSGQFK
jgi:ubiquinone/menaquinone biosynthesis C-methylase UbiE